MKFLFKLPNKSTIKSSRTESTLRKLTVELLDRFQEGDNWGTHPLKIKRLTRRSGISQTFHSRGEKAKTRRTKVGMPTEWQIYFQQRNVFLRKSKSCQFKISSCRKCCLLWWVDELMSWFSALSWKVLIGIDWNWAECWLLELSWWKSLDVSWIQLRRGGLPFQSLSDTLWNKIRSFLVWRPVQCIACSLSTGLVYRCCPDGSRCSSAIHWTDFECPLSPQKLQHTHHYISQILHIFFHALILVMLLFYSYCLKIGQEIFFVFKHQQFKELVFTNFDWNLKERVISF